MGIVIGLDIGGSTTKIIGLEGNKMHAPFFVRASNPVASLFGALGQFMYQNHIDLNDIDQIMITGVGSSMVEQPLYGIPTARVDEFLCNGLGGMYCSGLSKGIIVSMGTGTSLVQVSDDSIRHIGGIGIGGGTIMGLSHIMLGTENIDQIIQLANQGNIGNVDLLISDISKEALPDLPLTATASNFGKVKDLVSESDIAIGILTMVLQVVGKSAILASLNTDIKDFVMIGNLATLPQSRTIFNNLEQMFHVKYHVPEHAEYATAIGAALALKKGPEAYNTIG